MDSAMIESIFKQAAFLELLGIKFESSEPGKCVSSLLPKPELMQQNGVLHAGVLATMADHTAGAAAGTLIDNQHIVLTVEFKINLLRPGQGTQFRCEAAVLKGGRTLSVVESSVFQVLNDSEQLVAKAMVTIAILPKSRFG
jgi:uncharacterized protein (TIGR00369 family)